jgi:hypothetical protein
LFSAFIIDDANVCFWHLLLLILVSCVNMGYFLLFLFDLKFQMTYFQRNMHFFIVYYLLFIL